MIGDVKLMSNALIFWFYFETTFSMATLATLLNLAKQCYADNFLDHI